MMAVSYFISAAVLIYFSYRSLRGGFDYLRYFKEELSRPLPDDAEFVTVIAPCKGIDQGMADNFEALLCQDHPGYEVIFVIDDENDPASKVIASATPGAGCCVKMAVAHKAASSSQKVENLREGVLHADQRSRAFVFFDSDVRPSPTWLRSLTTGLADKRVGAATGYRWFVPERSSLAGELRSAWNASIASALGPNEKSNFCWGGSMAIRRDVFERLDIRGRWAGTLSDDFAVTRAIKAAGLSIKFVPQALAPTVENCTFREFFEFTNRQMKITRVYARGLWLMSFFGSGLFCIVALWSLAILLTASFAGSEWLSALITLALIAAFGTAKAWLRLKAVSLALPKYRTRLARQAAWQLTIWAVTPPIYLINCLVALFSDRIIWRGVEYQMDSAEKTRLIRPGQ